MSLFAETLLFCIPSQIISSHFPLSYIPLRNKLLISYTIIMSLSGPLLQKLFERLTAEEVAELFGAVKNMQPAASQSVVAAPTSQRKKRASKITSVNSGAFTFAVAEAQAPHSKSLAPARPLNSWMAFRSKSLIPESDLSTNSCRLLLACLQILSAKGDLRPHDPLVAE